MGESKDPERLLADALRAQAVFAPQADRTVDPSPPEVAVEVGRTEVGPTAESDTEGLPPQYGLISGAGADSLERERAALDVPATEPPTLRPVAAKQVPTTAALGVGVYWVLGLAVLLGLAAGSVVGLITLL